MPPLAATASNEELVNAIANAGQVTPSELAAAMGIHKPQACERLRALKFLGHVDEDSGRWRVSASWLIRHERRVRGQQDDHKHL
jgi:DNA-binding IclR family transcriptional regulator